MASNPLNAMCAVPLSASSSGATRTTPQTITSTILIKVLARCVHSGIAPWALQQETVDKVTAGVSALTSPKQFMTMLRNVPVGRAV